MSLPSNMHNREAGMSQSVFQKVADKAYSMAGIVLSDSKKTMMESRLRKRLRSLGLNSFESYYDFIESDEGKDEISELISSLTTNVSHFFREEHHFETLSSEVLSPSRLAASPGAKCRIWSAGCSNGQEPYSIAMTVKESAINCSQYDIKILATDIDQRVLATASGGVYNEGFLQGLSQERIARFGALEDGRWTLDTTLRDLVSFRKLNLISRWPMKGPFDAIFCRNVVIYFDSETQSTLWQRFADILAPGGLLFVGHSERVVGPARELFEPAGLTTYRKIESPGVDRPRAEGV